MNALFERLTDYIINIREQYPEVKSETLDNGGAIVYANGNDGTDFDFECNERLCEFMIYHGKELGEVGFIKCCVDKWGDVTTYVYPNGELKPVKTFEDEIFTENEVLTMRKILLSEADGRMKWDEYLENLGV